MNIYKKKIYRLQLNMFIAQILVSSDIWFGGDISKQLNKLLKVSVCVKCKHFFSILSQQKLFFVNKTTPTTGPVFFWTYFRLLFSIYLFKINILIVYTVQSLMKVLIFKAFCIILFYVLYTTCRYTNLKLIL